MTITPLGYLFLLAVCVCSPLNRLLSPLIRPASRPLRRGARRYLPPMAFTTAQTAFALWTAWSCGMDVWGSVRIDYAVIACVALFLLITLGTLPFLWRHRSPAARKRIWELTPVTPSERLLWIGISVLVGLGEEIVYRAVAFNLLLMLTGSFALAGLISATVFGILHLRHGWVSVASAFVFGLGFQLMVAITGGLVAAIIAHALYDLAAGFQIGAWGKREPVTLEEGPAIPSR